MSLNNKELNEGVSFCSETNVESGPQKIEEIKKYFSEMLNGILFVGNLNTQLIEQNEALKKQNEILLQMLLNLGITSSEIDEEIKATTDSLNTDDEENETSNVDGENETPEEDEKIKTSNVDGENEDSEEDEESKTSNVDVENETPKEDEESKTSNLDEENETPKENETSNVDGENEGFESPEKINLFLEILNDLYVSPSEETKKFLKAPTNNKEAKFIYIE